MDETLFDQWLELLNCLMTVNLSCESDSPVWTFEPSGRFSVKSFYHAINFGGVVPSG